MISQSIKYKTTSIKLFLNTSFSNSLAFSIASFKLNLEELIECSSKKFLKSSIIFERYWHCSLTFDTVLRHCFLDISSSNSTCNCIYAIFEVITASGCLHWCAIFPNISETADILEWTINNLFFLLISSFCN